MNDQRLQPLAGKPPGTLLIHEIYRSIQGESTFAGLPCVFVRLSVCDSRCVWCDTPHSFKQGELWTPERTAVEAKYKAEFSAADLQLPLVIVRGFRLMI